MKSIKNTMKNIEVIVRGFVSVGDKVLLCRNKGKNWFFLPGGHIKFGESAEKSLKREIKEELGISIKFLSFIDITENTYTENHKKHHEINLIFRAVINKTFLKNLNSREGHIEFVLKDLKSLSQYKILPKGIKQNLLRWLKDKKVFWRR